MMIRWEEHSEKGVTDRHTEGRTERSVLRAAWSQLKQGKSEGFDSCGLVILLKLDSNHRFFSPCDLEIWWMTPKNNRAPLLCYFKLFASFRSHWWIQTGVTVRKRLIWVKIDNFFEPCDLEIWQMTLKNNRAPLLCYFKLCSAFRSHWWIQTGVTVRKAQSGSKSTIFWAVWPGNLTDDLQKQ